MSGLKDLIKNSKVAKMIVNFLKKMAIKAAIVVAAIVLPFLLIIVIFFKPDSSGNGSLELRYQLDENGNYVLPGSNASAYYLPTGWWWPIGSKETITEGNNIFAAGTPTLLGDAVSCVGKNGGSKWGISAGAHTHSSNIGLDIESGSNTNKDYVVSVGRGTVTDKKDNITEGSIGNYNGGMGNYVIVDYGEIIVRYMHLYHGSIKVKIGDEVDYGQVLGTIGYNGDSSSPHSHTDYQDKSGNFLDPVDIVDPNNPRPMTQVAYGTVNGLSQIGVFLCAWENGTLYKYITGEITDYNYSPYIYKCITEDKTKYIMFGDDLANDGSGNYNFGFGVCFRYADGGWNNVENFAEEGINIKDDKYQHFGTSTLDVGIVDRVKQKCIDNWADWLDDWLNNNGIILNTYQKDACVACLYQGWGNYVLDFINAYKNYGNDPSIRTYCPGMAPGDSRYEANWRLFSEGKYIDDSGKEINVSGNSGTTGTSDSARIARYSKFFNYGATDILKVAEQMHSEMETAGYLYCDLGGSCKHSGSCGLDTTYKESVKGHHLTCCATYVSWVLQECGYISDSEHFNDCGTEETLLQAKGWNRYKIGETQLQAGDIIVYYGYRSNGSYGGDHYHTDIYVKDNQVLSAGGDIVGHYWNMSNTNDYYIYRPPMSTNNASGDYSATGYQSTYKSSITGKVFKQFKQIDDGTYPDISSVNCNWGSECGTVSTLIVGSGYKSSLTIKSAADMLLNTGGRTDIVGYLKSFTGKSVDSEYLTFTQFKNKLKKGYVAVVHNPGYSKDGHYVAVLDISSDGNKVYISNPAAYNEGEGEGNNEATKQGWNNAATVYNALDGMHFVK